MNDQDKTITRDIIENLSKAGRKVSAATVAKKLAKHTYSTISENEVAEFMVELQLQGFIRAFGVDRTNGQTLYVLSALLK